MEFFIGMEVKVGEGVMNALNNFKEMNHSIREEIREQSIERLCPDKPEVAGPEHCLCVNGENRTMYMVKATPGDNPSKTKPVEGTNVIPLDDGAEMIMGDALASVMESVLPQVLEMLHPGLGKFLWTFDGEEGVIKITGVKPSVIDIMPGVPLSPASFHSRGNA